MSMRACLSVDLHHVRDSASVDAGFCKVAFVQSVVTHMHALAILQGKESYLTVT